MENYHAQFLTLLITLKKSVNSISTTRAQLINKGIIYPVRYKELDFMVLEFLGYIQRLDEYQQWIKG